MTGCTPIQNNENIQKIQLKSSRILELWFKAFFGKKFPFVYLQGFPRWLSGEESPCKRRRCRKHRFYLPGSGRSPGVGNDNPLQDSSLGNPMDRGAWWATAHGVSKSLTWLSTLSTQQYSNTTETTLEQRNGDLLADLHEQWEGQPLSWSPKAALICSCFSELSGTASTLWSETGASSPGTLMKSASLTQLVGVGG